MFKFFRLIFFVSKVLTDELPFYADRSCLSHMFYVICLSHIKPLECIEYIPMLHIRGVKGIISGLFFIFLHLNVCCESCDPSLGSNEGSHHIFLFRNKENHG